MAGFKFVTPFLAVLLVSSVWTADLEVRVQASISLDEQNQRSKQHKCFIFIGLFGVQNAIAFFVVCMMKKAKYVMKFIFIKEMIHTAYSFNSVIF